jgi:hypothetical protein
MFSMVTTGRGANLKVTDEVEEARVDISSPPRQGDEEVLEQVLTCLQECATYSEGLLPGINKAVMKRQKKDYTRGLLDATKLNEDVIGKIGDYAATGKVDGGRKRRTKKSKKSAKKTRKSRRKL